MFGYACTDTKDLMPLPISLAHDLWQAPLRGAQEKRPRLSAPRWQIAGFRALRGRQAAVRHGGGGRQTQHTPEYSSDKGQAKLRKDLIETVINPTLKGWIDPKNPPEIYTNPTAVSKPAARTATAA